MTTHRYQKPAFYCLIGAGLLLWLINWWHARPVFIDEANVARNLFDRSFTGFFQPLDHQQYAPPFFMVVSKLCGELFSYGERALRLPAIAGWASGTLRPPPLCPEIRIGVVGVIARRATFC